MTVPDPVPARYTGVEDEFRIATADGRAILIDELVAGSERFFFDESAHVSVFQPELQPDVTGGRIWTWYGGTLYHDYDVTSSLIEATTPLTPLAGGAEALVRHVLAQRAQVVELARGTSIIGVSTHLNMGLDSAFAGDDLCRFETPIPSNAFISVPAQKLGADIALVAAHTISPLIAYLFFNRSPRKGALYRPRKAKRMELCLPYVVEPDQMRAGFAFWFAAVEYFTGLIKADLKRRRDWRSVYQGPEYYRHVLTHLPLALKGVRFGRPSYYLGFQISSEQETNVMAMGSGAVLETESGSMGVLELGKRYVDLFGDRLAEMGAVPEMALLDEFFERQRPVSVEAAGEPEGLHLTENYVETATKASVHQFLNSHSCVGPATVQLKFLRAPNRVINAYSSRLPKRIVRNLGRELEWQQVTLEVIEEDEYTVKRHLLKVPLSDADDYLACEDYAGSPFVYLAEIQRWTTAVSEAPNPRTIFAYGTLMAPEEVTRRFGATIVSVVNGHAYGEAYDFGEYPVLLENPRSGIVPGVLLKLANFEETAAKFDSYEGGFEPAPIFFRGLREVAAADFHRLTAWVYLGNRNSRFVREKLLKARRLQERWSKPGLRSH